MTLEDVRQELRERGGSIKAWALRGGSLQTIVRELGIPDGVPLGRMLFDIPIVFVAFDEPEGVIV